LQQRIYDRSPPFGPGSLQEVEIFMEKRVFYY